MCSYISGIGVRQSWSVLGDASSAEKLVYNFYWLVYTFIGSSTILLASLALSTVGATALVRLLVVLPSYR